MKQFVKCQQDILDSIDNNQLVSAGAGSGKTTVMIEKIANLIIKDNVPVENFLVVTFTVLAAGEMKDKLIKKLNELLETSQDKEYILSLIEQVKIASITTIDGFCSQTIKKYFYELNVSPNVDIVADTTRDYYLNKALKRTFDDLMEDVEKSHKMLELFGGGRRNLDNLKQAILNTYNNVINLEDYEQFVLDSQQEYQTCQISAQIVNQALVEERDKLIGGIIENNIDLPNEITTILKNYVDYLQNITIENSLENNLKLIYNFDLIGIDKRKCKLPAIDDINYFIKGFNDFIKTFKDNKIDENYLENNKKVNNYFEIIKDLLFNFINNYKKIKEKNNCMDFNDLTRLMLRLLQNEKVKKELQDKYTYIFVDEYQDVNPLQDKLISLLINQNTHLFTVGDVKQSIYGFRGSSPEWFLQKYNAFKTDTTKGSAFDMNVNFRSSPIIMQFVNEVFNKLMTKASADIDYEHDATIDAQRTDIVDKKVQFYLFKEEEQSVAKGVYSVEQDSCEKSISTEQKEAYKVAEIITSLIGKSFYDANLKCNRPYEYKDFAILSRSIKDHNALTLLETLRASNIPVSCQNELDVNKSEGIGLLLSILKCIANIADDVDYLATFMALSKMDINDIVEIRDKSKSLYQNLMDNINIPEIQHTFDILGDIKHQSYVSNNKRLINYILYDKRVRYYILTKQNGQKEMSQIDEFVNKISVEDDLSLAEFISVIESQISNGGEYADTDNDNSVTLQTIHKSKGLEYPVVILYNSSKSFNSERDAIIFNTNVGLGLFVYNELDRTKHLSLPRLAIKLINDKKSKKEELRLLYVALTRPKNRLFITGEYPKKFFETGIANANNYANMFLSVYQNKLLSGQTEFDYCDFEFDPMIPTTNQVEKTTSQVEKLYQDVDTFEPKLDIPFKNTVTGLNKKIGNFNTKQVLTQNTQYVGQDLASVGVHYHSALESLDYFGQYTKTTDFEDVDYTKIEQAHKTISQLCVGAISTRKEAQFNMYVPYNQVVLDSDVADKVLIQGIVDLIIEFADHVEIVDYKFSTLPIDQLKAKYQEQLALYKLAVENAFNKPVTATYIYSINTNELK